MVERKMIVIHVIMNIHSAIISISSFLVENNRNSFFSCVLRYVNQFSLVLSIL